jgi:hypothetical protein
VLEQPVIGELDAIRPGGVDERTEGGDVVLEHLLGLDEHNIGFLIERLGDGDSTVAAADDHDSRRFTI